MTTPRRTRLIRVPDLQMFRRVIGSLARCADISNSSTAFVVPSRGAARQLSRSLQELQAVRFFTRDELYDAFAGRLAGLPRRLTLFERDSMMLAAASAAMATVGEAGLPFQIRPGLVAEMLRFYDQLRRQSQSVRRFQELIEEALGGRGAETDRGAERLLRQTLFLAETFGGYERRVHESGSYDEHTLRDRLLTGQPDARNHAADDAEQPGDRVHHVVVTVPDWIADPNGLFVADFDLLSRLPGLATIDLVCTEAVLGSGFHQRLDGWWPGIEELDGVDVLDSEELKASSTKPRLIVPASANTLEPAMWFTFRDREEELIAVAGRAARAGTAGRAGGAGLDLARFAIVFNHPLPYLYLAPDTLGAAGIPFQSTDALPLAAEPSAAALDLALDAAETNFTRESLVALLRSPHFRLMGALDEGAWRAATAALDRALSGARFLGELSRLESLRQNMSTVAAPAFDAALAVARQLTALFESAPASVQIRRLLAFLDSNYRPIDVAAADAFADRERRGRGAIAQTLVGLADAHARHYDPTWSVEDLAASVRRWIGEQTFASDTEGTGVQLLDDQAARYAECDDLTIVGVVENEWPERPSRNIFYPLSLLKALGWPSEKDRRGAADARFLDLLASSSQRVTVSTFTLDDESLVSRSMMLDEIPRARLSVVAEEEIAGEAVRHNEEAGRYDHPAFHGSLGPQATKAWSVSALETYLDCPFKFFAQHVLRLQEEPEDEEVLDPRHQGQFVHKVFESFFHDWQAAGHQRIAPENLDAARSMFADVVDRELVRLGLTDAEAGLERTRLLGSPAAAGLGEAVFRMEAERPIAVTSRLLEHRLDGTYQFTTSTGTRTITLKGKADRLDLLADGTFRLIDYKLGWPPSKSRALQLPVYGLCAEQQLSTGRGQTWTLGEAAYLAFKGPKRVVPLFSTRDSREDVLAQAQQRLADTLDAIERGEFPPTPDDVYRCDTCSFASVCRKDYVGDM